VKAGSLVHRIGAHQFDTKTANTDAELDSLLDSYRDLKKQLL